MVTILGLFSWSLWLIIDVCCRPGIFLQWMLQWWVVMNVAVVGGHTTCTDFPSASIHLCEAQGWKGTSTAFPFYKILNVVCQHENCMLYNLGLFFWSFSSHRPKFFWNDQKTLSQFGHNVWNGRLVNTVMASFNTVMGQMT